MHRVASRFTLMFLILSQLLVTSSSHGAAPPDSSSLGGIARNPSPGGSTQAPAIGTVLRSVGVQSAMQQHILQREYWATGSAEGLQAPNDLVVLIGHELLRDEYPSHVDKRGYSCWAIFPNR